jgi:uncharacterized repeat protein (TIGR03803 family)
LQFSAHCSNVATGVSYPACVASRFSRGFPNMMIHKFLPLSLIAFVVLSCPMSGQTFHVLHTFSGATADGSFPSTSLLLDQFGDLFGASSGGGTDIADCGSYGCGTLFQMNKRSGYWKEQVLFNVSSTQSTVGPLALDAQGNLYGTSATGGTFGAGFAYQMVKSGGIWTQNILHDFAGGASDGANPYSGLIQDAAGNLYGATENGGVQNYYGTIFELTPNSDGTWAYSVIYEFGSTNIYDAAGPIGPLTIDSSGNLYGTTFGGGLYGYGAAFKLSPSGGTWTDTVLYNFPLDYGEAPYPWGVALDHSGNLYGATTYGGAYNVGTIYKLRPQVGYWNRTILYTFSGNDDGATPQGGLVVDSSGALYGTNANGGSYGHGNVYKLQAANGRWKETVLHSFTGSDGSAPDTGVIRDQLGNLYGTTTIGGADNLGVAFEITP